MEKKFIEIRDRGTFIPALALRMSGRDHYLARRAGFSRTRDYIILIKLEDMQSEYSEHSWGGGSRTMQVAHHYLMEKWEDLGDGEVVDVEYVLGETSSPKISECLDELWLIEEAG